MSATQGYGAKAQYGNMPTASGTTAWTDFANILDIKPPKIEAEDIDTSHMQSPNQFKQFAAGWATAGEAEFKIQFDKTQNATIYGLFRQNLGYRIQFNDGTGPTTGSHWDMDGYIKTFANEIDREKLVTADITVKIIGKPAFTPGT